MKDIHRKKKLNVAGSHYHVLPQISRRQLAIFITKIADNGF
ncbi:hypothetical protein [Ignatzschineria indica]|nr:hypothetical protein [Ignatzschineria indica]